MLCGTRASVRGLRKGLPIQQVAKLHNTSVKMIERHYAKYIATALEDLARAAVVSLVPRSEGTWGRWENARKGSHRQS
jgi:type II secretory pathway component PulK